MMSENKISNEKNSSEILSVLKENVKNLSPQLYNLANKLNKNFTKFYFFQGSNLDLPLIFPLLIAHQISIGDLIRVLGLTETKNIEQYMKELTKATESSEKITETCINNLLENQESNLLQKALRGFLLEYQTICVKRRDFLVMNDKELHQFLKIKDLCVLEEKLNDFSLVAFSECFMSKFSIIEINSIGDSFEITRYPNKKALRRETKFNIKFKIVTMKKQKKSLVFVDFMNSNFENDTLWKESYFMSKISASNDKNPISDFPLNNSSRFSIPFGKGIYSGTATYKETTLKCELCGGSNMSDIPLIKSTGMCSTCIYKFQYCEICKQTLENEQIISLEECKHKFCVDCAIESPVPITKCQLKTCKKDISPPDKITNFIYKCKGDFRGTSTCYCKTCGNYWSFEISVLEKPKVINCSRCSLKICRSCKNSFYNCRCFCKECFGDLTVIEWLNIYYCKGCNNNYCLKCMKINQLCSCELEIKNTERICVKCLVNLSPHNSLFHTNSFCSNCYLQEISR